MYVFPADSPVRKRIPSDEVCHCYWTEKAASVQFYPIICQLCLDFVREECLRSSPSPWLTNYKQSTWWRCVQCFVSYVLWCLEIQNQDVMFSWEVEREIFILMSHIVRLYIIVSLCWQFCVSEVDAASSGGWCQVVGEPGAGKQSLIPTAGMCYMRLLLPLHWYDMNLCIYC
jgi:hypothetical protein